MSAAELKHAQRNVLQSVEEHPATAKCRMKPTQRTSWSYQSQEQQTPSSSGSDTLHAEARDYFAVGFNWSHIGPKSASEDAAVNKFIVF